MSYARVIPRDLFNEANLLKCLGKVALILMDRPSDAEFDEDELRADGTLKALSEKYFGRDISTEE